MKKFVVCQYHKPFTERGSYGHENNPYYVTSWDKICDAREKAFQLALYYGELIKDVIINNDIYKSPFVSQSIIHENKD